MFSGLVLGLRGQGQRSRVRAGASGNTHQSELSGERPAGPPVPPGWPSSPEPWQRVRVPLSSPRDSEVPSETSLLGLSTKSRCGDPRCLLRGEGPGGSRPIPEHRPGRLAQTVLAGPLTASSRLTPGPQGRHQPAETCPRTAGTPRLLTAAPPVPAHRASSPKWDRPAVSPPRGLDQTVPEPQAPRDPPCPACSQGGHQPREGLPAPAPRLGGVTPRARGLLPGARMEPPERGDPVPSPQSPRRRSGPAGLPHGWKLPGSSGVCQKHELRWAYLERHSPRTGVHSTPSSVGGQAGWGQLQANPQTHTRRERLTQDGGQRGSRRRLESAHHPPPN